MLLLFLIFAKFNIATDLSAKDSREFLQNPISKIGLCYFNIKRKAQPLSTNISGKRTNGVTVLSLENFSLLNSYCQTAFYVLYLESGIRDTPAAPQAITYHIFSKTWKLQNRRAHGLSMDSTRICRKYILYKTQRVE
jgi:hypothetical protein